MKNYVQFYGGREVLSRNSTYFLPSVFHLSHINFYVFTLVLEKIMFVFLLFISKWLLIHEILTLSQKETVRPQAW